MPTAGLSTSTAVFYTISKKKTSVRGIISHKNSLREEWIVKKTFVTHMDDHAGAFLQACERISPLDVNITRVSYDKSIDSRTLFIEVEGENGAVEEAAERLARIGYLQDEYSRRGIVLLEFRLKDEPGRVLPVLRLINRYGFNISYINSQGNGSGWQSFRMGLLAEQDGARLTQFLSECAALCSVRVLSYDKTGRNLDNTVFYLSFAGDIAQRLGLDEAGKTELIISANRIMQNLDGGDSSPYKTFEYIGRFADCMQRYRGDAFRPRITVHRTAANLLLYLIEPPCGSNLCVLRCGGEYLFIDSGFACYRAEQLRELRDLLPDFDALPRRALITHADVDHCGMLDDFAEVYMSAKCAENFRRERQGLPNLREENALHHPYVAISKIVSGYRTVEESRCRVIGGEQEPQTEPLRRIGTADIAGLCFEAWEGAGGHVAGETVFIERTHRLAFTGDIYVNIKEFTPEQAAFNRLAPYLMTSVDSDPALAARERKQLMEVLGKGEWLVIGGHGAAQRLTI